MVGDNPYETCDLTPGLPVVPPADKNACAYSGVTPGQYPSPAEPPTSPAALQGRGTDQEALMQALTTDPAIAQKMVVVLKTQAWS